MLVRKQISTFALINPQNMAKTPKIDGEAIFIVNAHNMEEWWCNGESFEQINSSIGLCFHSRKLAREFADDIPNYFATAFYQKSDFKVVSYSQLLKRLEGGSNV